MSQQSSQDSQSQSDQESQNDNNTIETQSIYDGPYESCLNCPNETIVEGSCFCLMCYAELALCIETLDEEQNEREVIHMIRKRGFKRGFFVFWFWGPGNHEKRIHELQGRIIVE